VRFVFSPSAGASTELLGLPWEVPLGEWTDDRVLEIPQLRRPRHVVRFVAEAGQVFALKELPEPAARREHQVLRRLHDLGIPAVEVVGIVVDRADGQDAVLVTRFLDYSSSFLALFAHRRVAQLTGQVMNALVELLVRLHLAGVVWGDCSLSNTLFRLDAGSLTAYLVDAEAGEVRDRLSQQERDHDLEIGCLRVAGELADLQARGSLAEDADPALAAADLVSRYEQLWAELTNEELLPPDAPSARIAERIHRLHELGFDVHEVEIIDDPGGGSRLRLTTRVAEAGQHRHLLFSRTGLDVRENQAHRLLGDIASYRGWLEKVEQRRVSESVAALRWLAEVYEPAIDGIPPELRGRLDAAEVFHEVMEHRWFLSEAAGRDVGMPAAVRDYVERGLAGTPRDAVAAGAVAGQEEPSPE
jgi:hypothetical protein